jgi:hypothetical protein
LFFPNEESCSSLIGLEGARASELGCGVRVEVGRGVAKIFLVIAGVLRPGVALFGPGLGELVDFFWKKPRMDFWFLPDCDPEGGCFF